MATQFGRAGIRHFLGFLAAPALAVGLFVSPGPAQANGAFIQTGAWIAAPTGAQALCSTYSWACATSGRSNRLGKAELALIRRVNSRVNSATRQIADSAQYNRAEYWALPTRRGGDCEDFALLKKRELIRLGVSPRRLLLATALDRQRNSHAVLIVRSDDGDLVLDNQTSAIKRWADTRYVFLRVQNPSRPSTWQLVTQGS